MKLNESGFTFHGRHCRRDMGCWWIEKDGHPVSPETQRNEYEIAGVSGSVLMEGETRKELTFSGTLVMAQEPATQAEAQTKLRTLMAWLDCGRQRLVFDYEPGRYYLAQVDKSTTWSLKNWFGGELSVAFKAQPFAYAVAMQTGVTITGGTTGDVTVQVDTFHPAPLVLTIQNTGIAPITGISIMGGQVKLSAMALQSGAQLTISMEAPIDAQDGAGASYLLYAESFTPILLAAGSQHIPIELSYGSGSTGAKITASVRGRW